MSKMQMVIGGFVIVAMILLAVLFMTGSMVPMIMLLIEAILWIAFCKDYEENESN